MVELPPINAKPWNIVIIVKGHNWNFETPGRIIRVDHVTRSTRIVKGDAINISNLQTWKIETW